MKITDFSPAVYRLIVTIQSPHSQERLYEAFLLLMRASRHMNLEKQPSVSKLLSLFF